MWNGNRDNDFDKLCSIVFFCRCYSFAFLSWFRKKSWFRNIWHQQSFAAALISCFSYNFFKNVSEVYLRHCQTSMMDLFRKTKVKSRWLFLQRNSILDDWHNSKYVVMGGVCFNLSFKWKITGNKLYYVLLPNGISEANWGPKFLSFRKYSIDLSAIDLPPIQQSSHFSNSLLCQ